MDRKDIFFAVSMCRLKSDENSLSFNNASLLRFKFTDDSGWLYSGLS